MLEPFFRWIGYGLCHQLPSRSFFAAGRQLPVCARDTGIYMGFMLSLATIALLERRRRPTGLPSAPLLLIGAVGVAAMVVDGVTSYAGIRQTTNIMRLATGLAAGWALPLVVVPMLNSQVWRRADEARLLEGRRGAIWLAGLPAAFVALLWCMPRTGVVYPLAVSGAILATLTAVNLVFVTLAPRFERQAGRLRELLPQACCAFGLAWAEIALAGWVRWWLERAFS